MIWSEELPSLRLKAPTAIAPTDVLYRFDGPQIFCADFGFIQAIFAKLEDKEDSLLWIAAQTDDKTVGLIKQFTISVRCAFLQKQIFVVRTDYHLNISEYWSCSQDEVDESMLLEPGVSLNGVVGVPDSIEQATAFFAMRFAGSKFERAGAMRFSDYKSIVDNAFEATKRILSPTGLLGSRSSTVDFQMRQASGSLIIAVERPIVDVTAANRRLQQVNATSSELLSEFADQRDYFLEEIADLVDFLGSNNRNPNSIDDRFGLIDTIHSIIPTGDNDLYSVTFSAGGGSLRSNVTITEDVGIKIHGAYKELSSRPATERGFIEIINDPKCSFVIMSEMTGRQVTCYVNPDEYEALSDDDRFKIGTTIEVRGKFSKRARRDIMSVEGLPRMI